LLLTLLAFVAAGQSPLTKSSSPHTRAGTGAVPQLPV
jgi:hypothetical protein